MRALPTLIAAAALSLGSLAQPLPCDSLHLSFTASPDPVHDNMVHFDNTSWSGAPNNTVYTWSFGNGESAPGIDLLYEYPAPGTYTACLLAVSGNCTDSLCTTVVATGVESPCTQLNAEFTMDATGTTVNFHNASGTNTVAYTWTFGDNTSTTGLDPVHQYAAYGQYEVCLKAMTWDPLTQSFCSVENCEILYLTPDTLPGPCSSLDAGFQATVNGPVASFHSSNVNGAWYAWSFGDGASGFGPDPVHTYAQPGQYLACLTTWTWDPVTQDSCFAEHCEWVIVQGGGSPCDSLFLVGFTTQLQGSSALFVASASAPANSYAWDFGDGTSAYGQTAQHAYTHPGTYQVCVTAWYGNQGTIDTCMARSCQWITIAGGSSPCDSLDAGFQVTTQGLTATFHNNMWNPQQQYIWHFGDGAVGYGPQPTHTYAQPGQYHACLTTWVWDPATQDSCFAEHCEWVVVQGGGSPCDSLFLVGFTTQLQGSSALFVASASAPANNYVWDFGDGTSAYGQTAQHLYLLPGTYQVCVTAWYGNQGTIDTCMARSCQWITITGGPSPCDSLDAGFQVTTQGLAATFHNNMWNPQQQYIWHFGDGTVGYGSQPTHTYAQPGQYHACLTTWVWDPATQDSCFAEHCEWVIVQGSGGSPCDSMLVAAFAWFPGNASIFFQDQSITSGIPVAHFWDFGDGTTSTEQDPIHLFNGPGAYLVCLTIYAVNGTDTCSSTSCAWVSDGVLPSPCDSLNALFESTALQGSAYAFHATDGGAVGHLWSFGDGTTGAGADALHVYPGPGQYQVCHTAWSWDPVLQDSCFAEHCEWVAVQGSGNPCDSLVAPSFDWSVQGGVVILSNTSWSAGLPVSYAWSVDKVALGSDQQVTYQPSGPGPIDVCLTAIVYGNDQTVLCAITSCDSIFFGTVGLSERSQEGSLLAYPQPFQGLLTLTGRELEGTVRFLLMDMTGRVVDDRSLNVSGTVTLDHATQPAGAYILQVRTAKGIQVLRVQKQ